MIWYTVGTWRIWLTHSVRGRTIEGACNVLDGLLGLGFVAAPSSYPFQIFRYDRMHASASILNMHAPEHSSHSKWQMLTNDISLRLRIWHFEHPSCEVMPSTRFALERRARKPSRYMFQKWDRVDKERAWNSRRNDRVHGLF